MNCTQCQSKNIARNLRVLDRVGDDDKSDLALETHLSPHALFLTDAVAISLAGNVCLECGNVMFSIGKSGDLEKIRQATAALKAMPQSSDDEDIDTSPGFGSFLEDGSSEN